MRQILSTRSIPSPLLQAAAEAGAAIQITDFIRVDTRISPEAARAITNLCGMEGAPVVFTSKHAVAAVAGFLRALTDPVSPRWELYCISEVTRGMAASSFPRSQVSGSGAYAGDLARRILEAGTAGDIWFFSGDRRRDTLPERLTQGGLRVHETVVYETRLTPRKVPGFFDGILFFSPSGAESYFSQNRPDPRSVLFSIGETTAAALRAQAPNPVVVSVRQEAGALVRTMTDYFTKQMNVPYGRDTK